MKTTGEKVTNWAICTLFAIVLIALYAPVIIVILGAFYLDRSGNFDFSTVTLTSFEKLWQSRQILDSILNTIIVGFGAVVVSVILALIMAIYIHAKPRKLNGLLQFLIFLPFLLPPLVVGLSLLIFFREIGISTGLTAVITGHALFVLALVYRTILNRLTQMGHSLIEASLDLGATPMQTFLRVILPQVRGAIVIGAVLAFALSFDETLISLFLVGDQNTLPIKLWAMMRLGISSEVNALAAIALVVSLALVFIATRASDDTNPLRP